MRTIYLSTLNWADNEFFLIFSYIASLEQTWQNSSNINSRVELRALISSIRTNINPRLGFELLFETQFYDQATRYHDREFKNILMNCEAARQSTAEMRQFTALQRLNDSHSIKQVNFRVKNSIRHRQHLNYEHDRA
jgi:hypothetical protein